MGPRLFDGGDKVSDLTLSINSIQFNFNSNTLLSIKTWCKNGNLSFAAKASAYKRENKQQLNKNYTTIFTIHKQSHHTYHKKSHYYHSHNTQPSHHLSQYSITILITVLLSHFFTFTPILLFHPTHPHYHLPPPPPPPPTHHPPTPPPTHTHVLKCAGIQNADCSWNKRAFVQVSLCKWCAQSPARRKHLKWLWNTVYWSAYCSDNVFVNHSTV